MKAPTCLATLMLATVAVANAALPSIPNLPSLTDEVCSDLADLPTLGALETAIPSSIDIPRPPGFAYPINFVQIPKAGATLTKSYQHLTLKGVDKTNWYYLYPNTGGGSMSTLEFVKRMANTRLVNTKNNVTDSIQQAFKAESDGDFLKALQFYKLALANAANHKEAIADDAILTLVKKQSALLQSLQTKPNRTLIDAVSTLQKGNWTAAIKQKMTRIMGNTTEYLTIPQAIQNRLVQATLILRSVEGTVVEKRQIILTNVVNYNPLTKELTYRFINQPGRNILDYPDMEAPAAELYLSFQTPLPASKREQAGISFPVPPIYKQEFVVPATTAVVCKSQIRLYGADTIHYSNFAPSSAYLENNSPLGYPAERFMPQYENTYAALLTVHDGALKASTLLTYVKNCTYENSGTSPYVKCTILGGQKVSLLAGHQATLSLSSTSTTKPIFQRGPVSGRRLAQSSTNSTTCPSVTFNDAITAPVTTWSPGCLPPFVGNGFASILYSSLTGTGASSGTAIAASTGWQKSSLPVYNQAFTASALNAGGNSNFGATNRFCSPAVTSSNVYSSADFLSAQQNSVSISGAYTAPTGTMASLSASLSSSFQTAASTYDTSSQFGLVTELLATQGTINLPDVFSANASPDPNFLDNVVALLNQVNITQSDTSTQGTLNNLMFNFFEFYGDSVLTSAQLGAFFTSTVSTSTSAIASSASTSSNTTATLDAIASNTAASISGASVSNTTNGQNANSNQFASEATVAPPFLSSTPGNVGALNFTCPTSGPCEPDSGPWCDEYGNQPVDTLWVTFISGGTTFGGPGGLFNLPTAQFWTNAPWPTPFLQANFQTLLPQLATFYSTFIESCVNSSGAFVGESGGPSGNTCAIGTNSCTGYNFPTNSPPPYSSQNPACDSCLAGVAIVPSNGICSVGGTELTPGGTVTTPTGQSVFLPNTLGCSPTAGAGQNCVCSNAAGGACANTAGSTCSTLVPPFPLTGNSCSANSALKNGANPAEGLKCIQSTACPPGCTCSVSGSPSGEVGNPGSCTCKASCPGIQTAPGNPSNTGCNTEGYSFVNDVQSCSTGQCCPGNLCG